MEKDLKKALISIQQNKSAREICDYFTWDFADKHDEFVKNSKYDSQDSVLSFLNDEFIEIDTDYYDSPDFEERVLKTIDKAIEMLV